MMKWDSIQDRMLGCWWGQMAAGYVRWARSGPFDMGGTVRRATQGAMMDDADTSKGLADRMRHSAKQDSKANGALMRQSPLAIWGYTQDPRILAVWAREDARLTHPNRVCLEASAIYVATMAQVIRWGLDGKAAYAFALDFQRQYGDEPDVTDALVKAEIAPPPYSHHIGYVLLALHNAFYQLLHTESLEEAVVGTVMIGGDTDTNGAIAGALAGAVYGAAKVPQGWIDTLTTCRFEGGVNRPRRYLPAMAMERLQNMLDTSLKSQKVVSS